jgi:transposase
MEEFIILLYVGIDVASNKHDCCIIDGNGTVPIENFTFANNLERFGFLNDTMIS